MSRKRAKKPKLSMKGCLECGTPFQPRSKGYKFCSSKCRGRFWRRVNKRLGFAAKLRLFDRRLRVVEIDISGPLDEFYRRLSALEAIHRSGEVACANQEKGETL